MEELVKINENEKGDILINGRELHQFLEVKTKYIDWVNRMLEYGFEENIDFIEFNELSQKKEGSRLVEVVQKYNTDINKIQYTSLVTSKGIDYIIQLLRKLNYIENIDK